MIELKDVTFTYQTVDSDGKSIAKNGVSEMNLTIQEGEFLVLTGLSGCGKTTVIRLINGLIPHYYKGELSGSIRVNGIQVPDSPIYETAKKVGSVFQNPRTQFFNVNTTDEIAFAAENQGRAAEDIRAAITEAAEFMEIRDLLDRNIFELSGGEKQIIACAGVQVLSPDIIVLDEPSSNLDHDAIEKLKDILCRWNSEGKTIIVAEHRLYFLRDLADRLLILERGRIRNSFSREEMQSLTVNETEELGIRPLDLSALAPGIFSKKKGKDAVTIKDFHFTYKDGEHGIHIPELSVPKQGIIGIIGHNGAGKSTFVRNLCGLDRKCKGMVGISGSDLNNKKRLHNCYMIMQDVNHQLFTESVIDEVLLSMTEKDVSEEEKKNRAEKILAQLDLKDCSQLHPMALSGGQKQRCAIASGIASSKPIILFDEPTSGLDIVHMHQVAEEIRRLQQMEKTIFIVTHDYEFILSCCTHIIRLESGKVAEQYDLDREQIPRLKEFFQVDEG